MPGIHVSVQVYLPDSCDFGFRAGGDDYTDSVGQWGGLASSLYSPFTAHCFKVTVNADSTPPWPTQTFIVQDSVQFRFEPERHGESQDSVRLDVVIGSE